MAVESTFHKTHCGKPFNMAFCAQRAIRLHRVPKTREGGLIPLSTGGFRGLPHVLNFGRFYVHFKWGFMHLRPDFSLFGHNLLLEKIFLVMQIPNAGQNCFQTVTINFYFFSTACFFDIVLPMSPQVLESTFSTDPWWSFKEMCFRKDIHLVFSITCR